MSDEDTGATESGAEARPRLRIVRGTPTPEDLAVLTALVAASSGDEAPAARERRGAWSDPAAQHRGTLSPGPNGWRAALR